MLRTAKYVACAVIVLGLLAASASEMYLIMTGSSQSLVWNDNEAFLFIDTTRFGYRLEYAEYPYEVFREYFGAPMAPEIRRSSQIVFHITADKTERFEFNGDTYGHYTPVAGEIYAMKWGEPVKWLGDRFVSIPREGQVKIRQIIINSSQKLTTADGWSLQRGLTGYDGENKFEMAAARMTVVAERSAASRTISIAVLRRDRGPEQLLAEDQWAHRVDGRQYWELVSAHECRAR